MLVAIERVWANDPRLWPQGHGDFLTLACVGPVWLNGLMWTRCRICDSCQITAATVETESGFFLCEECEAVVVIAFEEFELSDASSIGDWGVRFRHWGGCRWLWSSDGADKEGRR